MAKIRADLKGIVIIDGVKYRAGDIVPARFKLASHIVEAVKDGKAPKGSPRTEKAAEPDDDA